MLEKEEIAILHDYLCTDEFWKAFTSHQRSQVSHLHYMAIYLLIGISLFNLCSIQGATEFTRENAIIFKTLFQRYELLFFKHLQVLFLCVRSVTVIDTCNKLTHLSHRSLT